MAPPKQCGASHADAASVVLLFFSLAVICPLEVLGHLRGGGAATTAPSEHLADAAFPPLSDIEDFGGAAAPDDDPWPLARDLPHRRGGGNSRTQSSLRRLVANTPYTAAAAVPTMSDADSALTVSPSGCPHLSSNLQSFAIAVQNNANTNLVLSGGSFLISAAASLTGAVIIESNAELIFDDIVNVTLSTTAIVVRGALRLGSPTCPLLSDGIGIELKGNGDRWSRSSDPLLQKGIVAQSGGTIEMFGERPYPTWTRLASTAASYSTTLNLVAKVDWQIGDEVLVVTSAMSDLPTTHQNEVRVIIGVVNGNELTLDKALDHEHFAGVEYATEVALLSRKITISGDDGSATSRYGGQTKCLAGSQCRFGGIAAVRMGQENMMGRYPFHAHLMGNVSTTDIYIQDSVVRESFFRGYTIHGTSNMRLSRNIAYDVSGSVFYLEDGIEEENLIEFNLAAFTRIINPLNNYNTGGQKGPEIETISTRIQPTDATATGFYCTNARNRWIGNAASGGLVSYHFPSVAKALGESYATHPNYSPESFEMMEFNGNTAHSNGEYWNSAAGFYVGGRLWEPNPGSLHYRYIIGRAQARASGKSLLKNSKAWACKLGVLFWGTCCGAASPGLILENFEAHDIAKSSNQLGQTVMYKAVITAHTGNSDPDLPGWVTGFQLYDTDMQTILSSVTFRNFNRPADVCIMDLTHSNIYKPQGMFSSRDLRYENTPMAQRFEHEHGVACYTGNGDDPCRNDCVNCPFTSGSSQLANIIDEDGSGAGGGKAAIMGADDENWETNGLTHEWWRLDDDCTRNWDWGFWLCNREHGGKTRSVVSLQLVKNAQSGAPPRHTWSTVTGKLYHFGHSDRYLHVGLARSPQVSGGCCDNGWFLDVEGGALKELSVFVDQMPPDDGLIFATAYPTWVSLTIQRCIAPADNQPPTCVQTTAASSLADVQLSDGSKHFVDTDGVLYLKLTLPQAGYFEHAGVKQLRRGYRWHWGQGNRYIVTSSQSSSQSSVSWLLPQRLDSSGGWTRLPPTTYTTTSVDTSCPREWAGCLNNQCCQGLGMGCYQKHQWYAQCLSRCIPGDLNGWCLLLNTDDFPSTTAMTTAAPATNCNSAAEAGLLATVWYFASISSLNALQNGAPQATSSEVQVFDDINFASAWGSNGLQSRVSQVDNFGIVWTGRIHITTGGSYTFWLDSDDGSQLFINSMTSPVVDNGGQHAMLEVSSSPLQLGAGYHNLRLEFFESAGGAGMIFRYSGPDTSNTKVVVPSSVLDHLTTCSSTSTSTSTTKSSATSTSTTESSTSASSTSTSISSTTGSSSSTIETSTSASSTSTSISITTGSSSSTTVMSTSASSSSTSISSTTGTSSSTTGTTGTSATSTSTTAASTTGTSTSTTMSSTSGTSISLSSTTTSTTTSSTTDTSVSATSMSTATTSTSTSTAMVMMYEDGLLGEIFYFNAIKGLWKLRQATQPNKTHVFSTVNIGYGTPNRWGGVVSKKNDFGIKFSGRLTIDRPGLYDFELESDDGSQLFLNGNGTGEALVVDNGGLHAMRTMAGQMWLSSAKHDMRIDYFERRAKAGVILRYSGPDTSDSMIVVPSDVLDHHA